VICSAVTPVAITVFAVLPFSPNRKVAIKIMMAPRSGRFVFIVVGCLEAGAVNCELIDGAQFIHAQFRRLDGGIVLLKLLYAAGTD
jgi:hypothetical protein